MCLQPRSLLPPYPRLSPFTPISPHLQIMEGLTTEQVVEHIIKPATQAQSCRYTTFLMLGPETSKQAVSQGRPFFFISHGWSRPFSELLVMLTRHFSPEQQSTWRRGRAPLRWSEVS